LDAKIAPLGVTIAREFTRIRTSVGGARFQKAIERRASSGRECNLRPSVGRRAVAGGHRVAPLGGGGRRSNTKSVRRNCIVPNGERPCGNCSAHRPSLAYRPRPLDFARCPFRTEVPLVKLYGASKRRGVVALARRTCGAEMYEMSARMCEREGHRVGHTECCGVCPSLYALVSSVSGAHNIYFAPRKSRLVKIGSFKSKGAE
jgi:hypothetical protein